MKAALKTLIVILAMLALPLQGLAAAVQPWCGATPAKAAAHCAQADAGGVQDGHAGPHAGCCGAAAASIAPALMASLVIPSPLFEGVPFVLPRPAPVFLAQPERPPQA